MVQTENRLQWKIFFRFSIILIVVLWLISQKCSFWVLAEEVSIDWLNFEILIIDILKLTKIDSITSCIKPLITGQIDSGIKCANIDSYQYLGTPQSLSGSSTQRTSSHVPAWSDMFVYYSTVFGIFLSFRSLLKTKTYSNLWIEFKF